jgi:hypothetical protein
MVACVQYQAEHAAQCVKDTAGAAADSAQLQQHRATGTVEQVTNSSWNLPPAARWCLPI